MKSELLRKALMSKMAVGGNVDGGDDDAKKLAKKVEKIPEGYEVVKDSKGNPVTNEAGDILYKKESKSVEVKKGGEKSTLPTSKKNVEKTKSKSLAKDGQETKKTIFDKPEQQKKIDYVYATPIKKEEERKKIIKETETKAPENKWAQIWGGERKWSRASQGMSPIYDKSGKRMFYESIDIPAQWDPKTNKWETAGGWGKPTTLYGVDVNGKLEVFDPTSSPLSYTEKGTPYYDYEKIAKTTGIYGKETEAALKEGPQRALLGFGAAQAQPFKAEYDPSKDVKQSINTMYGEGGPYVPVQPKKKGGIVSNYKNGGTASAGARATYNVGKSAGNVGGKSSGMGGNFDAGKLLSPDLISTAGEIAGSSIDALDRKDGRSSIAGQTASGAVKGAAKGYQMAGVPGAIIVGTLEAAMGARRGVKEKKERLNTASESARSAAIAAQEYDPLNPNPQPQGVKVHKNDVKGGLAGLFANGGQVKQISNSTNKINYAKGGTIKGAGTGTSDSIVADINKKGIPEGSFITPAKNNEMAKGIRGMVLGQNPNKVAEFKKGGTPKSDKVAVSNGEHLFTPAEKEKIIKYLGKEILEKLAPEAEENEMEKKKGGEMIKRADGSYSKRGLWDNIRANIGSGKKPTPEMLKQEKEIKSELKKGGYVVKRSSERKGKTHVVIGPDGTKKYFGDSKLGQHPNDPARKKAFYARHEKNLKKNPYFRAFARETWAEGGTVGSKMNKEMLEKELLKKANGGNVAVADKTKVKSPNVYEGKMPEKKELVSTLQESRVLERKDGTSKVEVKMPDGTWKTTYDLQKKAKGGTLTKSKAKEILHDKSVHGKPLTDKQRKYMGWVAGGKKNMGGIVGKYAMGGKVNRDWEWG